jgi:hypothetical protein
MNSTFRDAACDPLEDEDDLYEPQCGVLSIPCPNPHCQKRFAHDDLVLEHLSDPNSDCYTLPPDFMSQDTFAAGDAEAFSRQPTPGNYFQYHPKSGYMYGNTDNSFQKLQKDPLHPIREHSTYFPFPDRDEWELGRFLIETMTLTNINRFLKLVWVRLISGRSIAS